MTSSSVRQIKTQLQQPAAQTAQKSAAPHVRILFQGPEGSGKSQMVAQLSKETNRQVVRVDLSKLVSKYLGETEKNLEQIISRAEHASAILFFDEADALFGKRTEVKDAHDRYANVEIAYLQQRIERYTGSVIIATKRQPVIHHPLLQRMQVVVRFPVPGVGPRKSR